MTTTNTHSCRLGQKLSSTKNQDNGLAGIHMVSKDGTSDQLWNTTGAIGATSTPPMRNAYPKQLNFSIMLIQSPPSHPTKPPSSQPKHCKRPCDSARHQKTSNNFCTRPPQHSNSSNHSSTVTILKRHKIPQRKGIQDLRGCRNFQGC
jgi:hypothetical protein